MTYQPDSRIMTYSKLPKRYLLATIVAATLASPTFAHADEADMAEARKQFQAGVNLLEDPDGAKYEEAYSAFKKAYALSLSPKVLGNIGFCAMHLERDGEAIDAYTKYLAETLDVTERERTQIQKDIATLSSTAVRLRVVVKRPGGGASFVLVDTRTQTRGSSVENTYPFEGSETTIRVRPGRHTLKARFNGEESAPVDATFEPASQVVRELEFAPPKPVETGPMVVQRSPSLAGPVALGVTGLLALGAGTATGLIAQSKADAIQSRCPNDVCPAEYDLASARSSAKTFGTIADATLIGGGVLVGSALLWYVLLPSSRKPTTGEGSRPVANAMCTQDGCGLGLRGGF